MCADLGVAGASPILNTHVALVQHPHVIGLLGFPGPSHDFVLALIGSSQSGVRHLDRASPQHLHQLCRKVTGAAVACVNFRACIGIIEAGSSSLVRAA